MLISEQYALAMRESPKEKWEKHLDLLEKIVATPIFMEQYKNPFISDAVIFELIKSCAKKLSPLQKNLTKLLIRNRRLEQIKDIRASFEEYNRRANGQQLVQITTAIPPSPSLKKKLEEYAGAYLPEDKEPVFEYDEEAALIGGFTLSINGYIINKSIKSRLKAIEYTQGE
ncbi:MAG: ATP synthase F1 subunit delta [Pseudomonadota bacterium]|nr:ATP synthase F1 subunit delta [Pseudomonadota bacterium]